MSHWGIGYWILLLCGLRAVLHLVSFPAEHDVYGLLVVTGIFVLAWRRLGLRPQLKPFLLGVLLYWLGSWLDWIDGLLRQQGPWGEFVDTADDILFAVGFFFIALAFIRVMLERDGLESKLYQQAYRDELTGLGNRRALFEQLELRLKTGSGTLLYVDVDHFKSVNDQHGHDAGDQVLKTCAQVLASAPGAQAFRLGGDEFVLLLDTHDPSEVEARKDALHAGTQALSARYGIALSIGVTPFQPGSVPDADTALKLADQQMYEAKRKNRSGRQNRQMPR